MLWKQDINRDTRSCQEGLLGGYIVLSIPPVGNAHDNERENIIHLSRECSRSHCEKETSSGEDG